MWRGDRRPVRVQEATFFEREVLSDAQLSNQEGGRSAGLLGSEGEEMTRPDEPSEFGGHPGPIQPEPHPLTNAELARLERRVNPADPTDSVEAARVREGGKTA